MNTLTDLKELDYRSRQVEREILVEKIRAADHRARDLAKAPTPQPITDESRRIAAGGHPHNYLSPQMEKEFKAVHDARENQTRANLIHARSTDEEKAANELERDAWALYRRLRDEACVVEQ